MYNFFPFFNLLGIEKRAVEKTSRHVGRMDAHKEATPTRVHQGEHEVPHVGRQKLKRFWFPNFIHVINSQIFVKARLTPLYSCKILIPSLNLKFLLYPILCRKLFEITFQRWRDGIVKFTKSPFWCFPDISIYFEIWIVIPRICLNFVALVKELYSMAKFLFYPITVGIQPNIDWRKITL